jgi:hypothetical protein
MKRSLLLSLLLLSQIPARAEEVIRPVAAVGDLTLLTAAQREWLIAFESGALKNTAAGTDAGAAASWLDETATGARDAGLANTSAYLTTAARVLRGDASVEDAEKSWRRTLDDPLIVIVHFDGKQIADLTVCTCDPARARAVEKSIERFQRSLPGFEPSWLNTSSTREMTRIANLHFRAGRNADSALTGSYLPFDRSLTAGVGRTWVVYENMIRANWWGEGLRPIAMRLLPNAASKATAEAMVEWYGHRAPLYDAGPNLTPAQRDRLGSSKDPMSIIKGDLLPVLLVGVSDESIATLATVSFHTLGEVLRGAAPPQHKAASATEINWLVERGGLRFDAASVTWQVDYDRCRAAVRELATLVMAIERAGNAKRAETLLARYGILSSQIDKTLETINALPRVKVQPVFVR